MSDNGNMGHPMDEARQRAHERVYAARFGSTAPDQSDDDICALRAQLYQWIEVLDAEMHSRIVRHRAETSDDDVDAEI